ncbi:probable sodium/sulfate cotransporter 3 [Physcomitrium patens]|uniref:RCK C-terminal domain-containing protein n=1 Tax=Physcomitrium patens TaxID=3218 RepID=A0A2K1IE56_PHYPA|nr:probable sodium/sulfate cotransporter 3 isoform X2 [Physcomitrium patens]PNR27553.1 hypothetical protein PHYPA_029705 [Physcomitrium patens]|eukprot:XP_024365164.1 probable sodium/sulfate cotransporter 3 isoform X2 [Physcomitrella patens]
MVQLGWESYLVLATLIAGLVVMAGDWVGPDFVFALMVGFLTACRVITVKESTEGFSQNGVLTVVILFVVAEGIGQTGGMEKALNLLLGKATSPFWAITRMFIPVAITSAFLNNTPIVALLIPIMIAWGRRNRISPKKLLIPLSYAAVFGGTLTQIGTSTNFVISSLQEKRYTQLKRPGDAKFGMFDITPYGIVYCIGGFLFTVIASHWLLPSDETKRHSDLLLVARVPPESPVANNTVREAGLKGMERLFLVAVERQGRVTHAVGPQYLLEPEDLLYFCGELEQAHFYSKAFSLELLTNEAISGSKRANFQGEKHPSALENGSCGSVEDSTLIMQASVRKGADIIGKTLDQIDFRKRFDVAVLGLKRGETHQPGPLSEMVVNANDVLVLLGDNEEVLQKPEVKAVFKDVEKLDEALEKEYLTGMKVTNRFKGVGKTVYDAGLRGINGLTLLAIDRQSGEHLKFIEDDTVVELGDTLWFAGGVQGVHFLLKISGLEHSQAPQVSKLRADILYRQLVKASVASESPLVGNTVREAHFRNKYDAVVLAIHRQGERLSMDVRDVKLRAGDVLLLDTGSNFGHRYRNDAAFSLISGVPESSPVKKSRMWVALFLGAAMIATQIVSSSIGGTELINLFTAGILTSGLMLLTRCLSADQARNSIDWRVYTTIAFAIAFSTCMEKSKLARAIADIFIKISESIGGMRASYVAIYIATALLSELVSNNAAAAIMYPIAADLGDALGVVPTRMSVVVMLGASAGFTLPYSYQTNLMVYAAGDYRFMEFAKFGLPCQCFMIITVILIFLLDNRIWVAVGLGFALMLVVLGWHLVWEFVPASIRSKFSPGRKEKTEKIEQ